MSTLVVLLVVLAGSCLAADSVVWEPGRVTDVLMQMVPAKEPDASCKAVPRGSTPPPNCRPQNLKAQVYWRVTLETSTRRMVVRPYRQPNLMQTLNDNALMYVDPMIAAGASVEVAIVSKNTIRFRTDLGQGTLAQVDSQELLSSASPPAGKIPLSLPPPKPIGAPTVALPAVDSALKIVLLENSDFRDLEVQQIAAQDIGDGASLYTFSGDASAVRVGSNRPVFLVLTGSEGEAGAGVDLARMQVGRGQRQLVYSRAGRKSASSVAVSITKVSPTVLRVTVGQALTPGEYAILPAGLNRGFLFEIR